MTDKKKGTKSIKADISPEKKRNISSTDEISYYPFENNMKPSTMDATFYATAILHLCGNMDIQSGIKNFYDFLKEYIPVKVMTFGRAYPEKFYTDFISICNDEGIVASNLRIHHSELVDVNIFTIDNTAYATDGDIIYVAHGGHILLDYLAVELPDLRIPPSCCFMRIKNEVRHFGGIFFFCEKDNPFTEKHIAILQSLHLPFSFVLSNSLQCMELNEYSDNLLKDNLKLKKELLQHNSNSFIGKSTGLAHIYDRILKVAPIDINVLITGETGVGKDIVAHTIYKESVRKDKPYIIVNCAAIAPSLIDSELFGHRKGSFTGAIQDHKGFFEQADTGTLFLDEIGELPLESQSRLLRTLQDGSVRPVGSTKEIKVNFRLISATNQNLEKKIQQGLFREDLYFRLNELSMEIPPLRQRKQDIPLFVRHFLDVYSSIFNIPEVKVSEEEMHKLIQYAWPGNVRELQNTIKSTLVTSNITSKNMNISFQLKGFNSLKPETEENTATFYSNDSRASKQEDSTGATIRAGATLTALETGATITDGATEPAVAMMSYEDFQRLYFLKLLDYTKGKIKGDAGAAFFAKLHPNTLRSKLDKLKIEHRKK